MIRIRIAFLAVAAVLLAMPAASASAQPDSPSLRQAVELHAAGHRNQAYDLFAKAMNEARHAFHHEDYVRAEALFSDWIEHFAQLEDEDPANLTLPRSYLARCIAAIDGPTAALPLAEEIFATIDVDHHDHTDERAVVALNAGVVLMANGDLARAELCLEEATHTVQEMPQSPVQLHLPVLDALRSLRVRQGRLAEAREITDVRRSQLETRRAADPELDEALGLLESAHELRTAPGADFREVAARMAASVELLRPYLGRNDPFVLRVQVEQAQALLHTEGTTSTARHLLEDAIARYEKEPVLNREGIGSAMDILALAAAQQGDFDRAVELLEESLLLLEEDGGTGTSSYEVVRTNYCALLRRLGRADVRCL